MRKKGGQQLMAMSRRNKPDRGEQNITYNPELAAYAEGKEVFEAGYVHPLATGYQARMPEPEPPPPSIAEDIDPYLDRLNEAEIGITEIEDTLNRHRKRRDVAEADWNKRLDDRKKLEEELSKPKPPPQVVAPPPPPVVTPPPVAVKEEPPQAPVKSDNDRQVWMVEYKDDLGSYIQNLLNAQIPLPRYLYIKDIDQEIDLLGRVKDEDGNPLAERWFADDEMLLSDVYRKEFENAVKPATKKQIKDAAETTDEESGRRIQDLIKEYREAARELETELKKAKGK